MARLTARRRLLETGGGGCPLATERDSRGWRGGYSRCRRYRGANVRPSVSLHGQRRTGGTSAYRQTGCQRSTVDACFLEEGATKASAEEVGSCPRVSMGRAMSDA